MDFTWNLLPGNGCETLMSYILTTNEDIVSSLPLPHDGYKGGVVIYRNKAKT
jgi:hypothetical protein